MKNTNELTKIKEKLLWYQDAFFYLLERMARYRLPQMASSLSYTTVLSMVPLLAVMLSIFTGFPMFNEYTTRIQEFMANNLLPERMSSIVTDQINSFVEQSRSLSLVGGVMLLVTSVMTMFTIERVFNDIWQVRTNGEVRKRIMNYWAVLTIGPIMFGSILAGEALLVEKVSQYGWLRSTVEMLFPLLIVLVCITSLYWMLPNKKIEFKDALMGAVFASLGVLIVTHAFSFAVKTFNLYKALYSAFGIIPAFFFWLYLIWLVILFGAALAASMPYLRYDRWRMQPRLGQKMVDGLMVLNLLFDAQRSPARMLSSLQLQDKLQIDQFEMQDLLTTLERQAWIGKVQRSQGESGWTIICDVDEVTFGHVFNAFTFDGRFFASQAEQLERPWGRTLTNIMSADQFSYSLRLLFQQK